MKSFCFVSSSCLAKTLTRSMLWFAAGTVDLLVLLRKELVLGRCLFEGWIVGRILCTTLGDSPLKRTPLVAQPPRLTLSSTETREGVALALWGRCWRRGEPAPRKGSR